MQGEREKEREGGRKEGRKEGRKGGTCDLFYHTSLIQQGGAVDTPTANVFALLDRLEYFLYFPHFSKAHLQF